VPIQVRSAQTFPTLHRVRVEAMRDALLAAVRDERAKHINA